MGEHGRGWRAYGRLHKVLPNGYIQRVVPYSGDTLYVTEIETLEELIELVKAQGKIIIDREGPSTFSIQIGEDAE